MKSANGLYPIIRRIRRPLLPVDPPAENKPLPIREPEELKPQAVETPEVEEKRPDAEIADK
jgi:hypothetical protein